MAVSEATVKENPMASQTRVWDLLNTPLRSIVMGGRDAGVLVSKPSVAWG